MDLDSENIVRRMIDLYAGSDYSVDVEHEFRQWLISDFRKDEKTEVLWDIWNSLEPEPEAGEDRALRKIKKELGLLGREKAFLLKRKVWLSVAAVIALLLMIPVVQNYLVKTVMQVEQPLATTVIAGVEERKHVDLSEATQVWLNCNSEVVYDDPTAVELNGEAYFDVKKEKGALFSVRGGGLKATVTGTNFNYRSFENEPTTVISLYEGSLEIESPDTSLVLRAGFELIYNKGDRSVTVRSISRGSPDWMRDIINFENEKISAIFRALENIYGVTITDIGSDSTNDLIELKFEGGIELEEVLYFMSSITGTFDFEIDGDRVLIYWII